MPGPTTSYDPAQTILSFLGNHINGYAPGTYIKVSRDEDAWKLKVGADGEKARAKNNNKAGKIVITLLQSSPSNDILSNIGVQDELDGTGIGAVNLDETTQGTTAASCPDAYIGKMAEVERGDEIAAVEWTIICPQLDLFVGGALEVP